MNRYFLAAAAAAAAFLPTVASAVTYDAFSSFNGTQGAGNFYYGEADPSNPGTSGTFFTANTNCFIDGATCLQLAANHDVPGFTKGGSPDFQYGSVNVPDDRLLAHPDDDSDQTFIAFVAPTAGRYRVTATFNVQDVRPSGVGINLITTTTGGLPLVFTPLASINAANTSYTYTGVFDLGASYAVGFGLDNGGSYSNDSTGVNVTVASVPEPAAWAMMIVGFGASGAMIRRRKTATATAA
jgi:opacity protein-like surface antigen